MEKKCAICGKSSSMGGEYYKLISRYNPSPKKRKYPNLQWVKIPLGTTQKRYKEFAGKKVLACAKCIKALTKKN
ncbi:MAG TPA: L28 family ribosomal protein [Candidatus Pacearchaeota archaeon]|nr:L28 family ribosomal protein [Candidatus Pacearchaeota archaeon]